ncbi:MAG: serine hydrolase domain-containing protein, partial [Pacificimonas sp.]
YAAYVRVAWNAEGQRVVTARGSAEPGRAASAAQPVRIASISKLVATIGLLRMVDGGRIDLDGDVSDYLGWQLRNPAAPDVPVTLTQILSHQAGLSDAGGYVVPLGTDLRDFIGPDSWRGTTPGESFEYANLGSAVVATVMERVSGERFDRLMRRLVFAPMRVDACYNWDSCSEGARARGMMLPEPDGDVLRDDRAERLRDCQVYLGEGTMCDVTDYMPGTNGSLFSPQGGLRIGIADLARLGRALAVRDARLLSPESYDLLFGSPEALGEASRGDPVLCLYGLTIQRLSNALCGQAPHMGPDLWGHAGEAYHLRSGLWFDPEAGTGVAYVLTGLVDPAADGASGWLPIERAALAGTLE